MTPTMLKIQVNTASELFELFTNFDHDWHFRGHRDADWDVSSTLERIAYSDPYAKEKALLEQFLDEYGIINEYDAASILSLMQHYATDSASPAIGTRLVDVTRDYNIAAYFALANKTSTASGQSAIFAFNTLKLSQKVIDKFKSSNPENIITWVDELIANRAVSQANTHLYHQGIGAIGTSFFRTLQRLSNGRFSDSLLKPHERMVFLVDPKCRLDNKNAVVQSIFNQRLVGQEGAFLVPFGLSGLATAPQKGTAYLTAFEECLTEFLLGSTGFDRSESVKFFRENNGQISCSDMNKATIADSLIVKVYIPQALRDDVLSRLTNCSARDLRLCSAPSCN